MSDTRYDNFPAASTAPAIGAVLIDYSGGDVEVSQLLRADGVARGKSRGLVITTTGDLKITTAQGDTLVHPFPAVGIYPIEVVKIFQADSDAAGVIWW